MLKFQRRASTLHSEVRARPLSPALRRGSRVRRFTHSAPCALSGVLFSLSLAGGGKAPEPGEPPEGLSARATGGVPPTSLLAAMHIKRATAFAVFQDVVSDDEVLTCAN